MRWWPALVMLLGCGDNLAATGAPLQRSDELVIIAHPDDDLVFMQPDLSDAIAAGRSVTTVYVTAGDGGKGVAFSELRLRAARAAYGMVAGSQDWTCGWIEIADHEAQHCRLADRPISLVMLGIPDGGVNGDAPQGLRHLFDGAARHAETIAAVPARYTRDSLIATVAAVIETTRPATIRTLDLASTHGPDHPDHAFTGTLVTLARASSGITEELLAYRGYNISGEPPTITDDLADRASLPMRAYEACALGCGECGVTACPTLTDPRYAAFVQRRYAIATRHLPLRAQLHGDSGCALVDHGALVLGDCSSAPEWMFDVDGSVHAPLGCLEVEADGSVRADAPCAPGSARTFVIDDEGHVWTGIPAPASAVTLDQHATCLAPVGSEIRAAVCGAQLDATWRFERPVAITPRQPGATTGRAVRIADLSGDGKADLCAEHDGALICAVGDGAGSFGADLRVDSPDAPLQIDPNSLALGDVDGDGAADACGEGSAAVRCATAASGYRTTSWALTLPRTCVARTLQIADQDVCALDTTGLVCAQQTRSLVLSTWPEHRSVWVGDLDGDGEPDWCAATDAGPACARSASTTTGASWAYSQNGVVEGSAMLDGALSDTLRVLGDVTGDGRADRCELVGQRVLCAASNGHGFGPRSAWLEVPDGLAPDALWLGDLDGDGKLDPCVDSPGGIACALSP